MQYHQVEIDEEVFEYVKQHAEPLVDNFNSALRKLLSMDGEMPSSAIQPIPMQTARVPDLDFPGGVPRALRHSVEVVYLIRKRGVSRPEATQMIARSHGVRPQTVLDKYCRQLGLSSKEFDQLLDEEDLMELRNLLKKKFPQHPKLIDDALLG